MHRESDAAFSGAHRPKDNVMMFGRLCSERKMTGLSLIRVLFWGSAIALNHAAAAIATPLA